MERITLAGNFAFHSTKEKLRYFSKSGYNDIREIEIKNNFQRK